MDCMEKKWKLRISLAQATVFLHSSTMPFFREINELLKNYWDDRNIMDQGHDKGNILKFCWYIGYRLTPQFKNISTTMIAPQPATKNVWSSDLENIGKDHNLKIAVSYPLNDRFLPNFHRNENAAGNKNVISADFENVHKVIIYKNHYNSLIISPILTKFSIKWCNWGW